MRTAADEEDSRRVAKALRALGDEGGGLAAAARALLGEGERWATFEAAARVAALRSLRRGRAPAVRALLVGDVHGEHEALGRCLARFCGSVDAVLAVGDVVDPRGPGRDVARAVELLSLSGALCVAGNHDRWWLRGDGVRGGTPQGSLPDAAVSWLRGLPRWRAVETAAGLAVLAHGLVGDDMEHVPRGTPSADLRASPRWGELLGAGACLHIGGHVHESFVEIHPPVTFVNAGTLQGGGGCGPCVLVADFELRRVRSYPLGPDGSPAGRDAWEAALGG